MTCSRGRLAYCLRDISLLHGAEICIGIVVACVPTIGPIFRRRRQRSSPAGIAKASSSKTGNLKNALRFKSRNAIGSPSTQELAGGTLTDDRSWYGLTETRAYSHNDTDVELKAGHGGEDGAGIGRVVEISVDSRTRTESRAREREETSWLA